MAIRENFTNDEWQTLLNVPYEVSMTIVTAAPSLLGAFSESRALISEPAKLASSSGSDLVGVLSSEMQSKAKDLIKEQQSLVRHDQAGYRQKTIEDCKSAATILSKVTPEEAAAYKRWVLAIGQSVAEAAKEKGGVVVNEAEQAVLNEVSAAFGMGA